MKTIQFTSSPALLYQEPRRIPPYMAAIIRRHRFTIIIIICFLILMIFSWHLRSNEKVLINSTPISYVIEDFNDGIQISGSNKQYFSDVTEISNNKEEEQPQFINTPKLPEDEEIFPFLLRKFPTDIQKEAIKYHVEEHFIPTEEETDEFTTEDRKELEEKSPLMISDKEAHKIPSIQRPETELSSPSKIVAATKYLYFEESPFAFAHKEKPFSLSPIQQPEEGFPPPDQDDEWAKTQHVTFSMSSNITDTMDMLSINKHSVLNQQESPPIESDIPSAGKNPVLLIDTPGCNIPRLDPWDPTIRDLIELQDPYVCPGLPVFLKSHPGGSITFNKTILETYYNITSEELVCYYQPIYRKHEEESSVREDSYTYGNVTKLDFGVPLNEDYVGTSCNIKGKTYEQFLPLVPLKEDVEKERNSIVPPNPALNVILIGIDSVSKLNFLRHFPRTHAFLNEKLKPFEMNGYTKVGDNTFPNLVPMLTGQFVEYWWNETVMDTMFFDNIGLIWKEFAKRGYRTFYAEDYPFAGTFNYSKRGFYHPPTDYYFRPLALALEMWKFTSKQTKLFCLNSQIEFDVIYDYLKVYAQTMDTRPFFGFAMVSTITHDVLNYAGWADEPTERLLEGLYSTGVLNNTLLVLFSDHGLRYGKICNTYIGKFEARLPLMYIHVPKWFLDQNPGIAENMQINQDRLMTLFDVHATMVHLLDFKKNRTQRAMDSLGNSLFEEISPYRTCSDAKIQPHFCPCQTFDSVVISSPEAINASQAVVDDINSKLQPYGGVCEVLEVDTIMDARVGKVDEYMLKYLKTENEVINKTIYIGKGVPTLDDYMITLVTKPGGAVFEGSVRHNPKDDSYGVLGISRISMYGNTSWCIDSQKMKIFCYCKIQHLT
ncbi:hypothetical protein AVEN_144622-1 [Araneus ventricosus]|uniref:Uncharacterized protein n=1 Tax=Araneus ventricosus TaxID=182803 RepID=A0A4Y2BYP4_ARAVE|nr:hypothetical protein AVEN_144622-1 [Araneus ventricosus]